MRKELMIILILFSGKLLFAQAPDIIQAEYFIDTDPGFGNGTQLSFTSDSIIDMIIDIDISSLSYGNHRAYIRTKDETGKWSITYKKDIYKTDQTGITPQPLKDIVATEYFFNYDPGYGNAVPLNIIPDSIVDVNFIAELDTLNYGSHLFNIRVKDEDGNWSLNKIDSISIIMLVDFSVSDTLILVGNSIQFTDLSAPTATSWEWDFQNDGTPDSYIQNPEWTFIESGTYSVSLTVSDGTKETVNETKLDYIYVLDTAIILSDPISHSICENNSLELNVSAAGDSIHFQWQKNEINIPGAIDSSYNIYNATISDSGHYRCIVSNFVSGDTSTTAIIVVNNGPIVSLGDDTHICSDDTIYLDPTVTGNAPPYTYLWSQGGMDSTIVISTTVDTTISLIVTDNNGCEGTDTINLFSREVYQNERICIVTVDSASQRNMVIWEKTPGKGTAFYKIYRNPNVYDTVPFDSASISIDYVADPIAQPWQYFITAVDSCGFESNPSPIHQTIYLTASSVLSGNVSLEWEDYIGFDYAYFYIYRGESLNNLNLIDSVYYTYPNVYTDVNPPPLDIYYRVVVNKHPDSICDPSFGKTASGPFKKSLSNIGDGGLSYQFQVKIFLEGPYNYGQMSINTSYQNIIQRTQPFNTYPWFYEGEEQIQEVPSDVVDWVLFELRKTTQGPWTAYSDSVVFRRAAFLQKYGYIVDLDGISYIQVNALLSGNVHVVLEHRNHIGVMSEIPLDLSESFISYNFTNNPDKFFGSPFGYKELGPGTWGMASGDINRDGVINLIDKDSSWVINSGQNAYLPDDLNLDGQINNIDKNDYWQPNMGKGSQVPE